MSHFLYSPVFKGVPTAPTPASNDNSTRIATTAFIAAHLAAAAAAPLSYSGGVLSIAKATSIQAGYLAAADFAAFAGKQDALGFAPLNKAGDTLTGALVLAADPTQPMHATTKQWVESLVEGAKPFGEVVRVATTTSITLTGTPIIDGIQTAVGDIVLVKDQSSSAQNGVYVVASGSWSRHAKVATFADHISQIVRISEGTVNADTTWYCGADKGGTLGSTAIPYIQWSGTQTVYTAGTGLTKTGGQFALTAVTASRVLVSDAGGILSASSVTATELGYLSGVTSAIQTQLNAKAPLASPALTGTPTAPTAATDTNTTQIATTQWVIAQASAVNPANLGSVSIGTSTRWARADHTHAFSATGPLSWSGTQLSIAQATASVDGYLGKTDFAAFAAKAPTVSPAFTGTPTAPTAAANTNTTQIATTQFVMSAISSVTPTLDVPVVKSAAYTTTGTGDRIILCDATTAAFAISLEAAPVDGQTHFIKKVDASTNSVTVNGNGKNIDGDPSFTLIAFTQAVTVVYSAALGAWVMM